MKRLEIDFRTNFQGCDYSFKLITKCSDPDDILVAKKAIDGHLEKMFIDFKEMEADANRKDS